MGMKRRDYAQRLEVRDKTAWRWWRAGKLDASQLTSGVISVREPAPTAIHPSTHRCAGGRLRTGLGDGDPTAFGGPSGPPGRPLCCQRLSRLSGGEGGGI